jgi:hypothetical protein
VSSTWRVTSTTGYEVAAVPVPVPTPVAVKITPTVFAEAPINVKSVVPTETI